MDEVYSWGRQAPFLASGIVYRSQIVSTFEFILRGYEYDVCNAPACPNS
jgi:hypothetical protein